MPTSFDVDKDVGTDALNVAHQIKGFLEEKTGDAEILRKASDRPLVRSGSTEVVIVDRGDRFEVTFTGADFGQQDLMDAIGKLKVSKTVKERRDGSSSSSDFEFGEHRDVPRFDVVTFKGQTAIVRTGENRRGEVQRGGMELPDALEYVRQEAGLDGDDLVTVFRPSRAESIDVNPLVHPDDVAEGLIIAAVETPGLAQTILGIGDDDPNKTFTGVGDPSRRDFVVKPFSQDDARYINEGDAKFDSSHPRCKDCAHFDGHGNCLIVPNIEPDGYCEEFFADVGIYGVEIGAIPEVNLTVFGEMYDWSQGKVDNFLDRVRQSLSDEG